MHKSYEKVIFLGSYTYNMNKNRVGLAVTSEQNWGRVIERKLNNIMFVNIYRE